MTKRWRLRWDYASSMGGPWTAGEVVELDEALAEAINRDSPEALEAAEEPDAAAAISPEERVETGKQDRMARSRRKR